MKYALNLAEDGRILSVTFEQYATSNAILVDNIPEGDIADFRYVNGEYINEPRKESIRDIKLQKIHDLKQNLASTDYNILKIVEGAATLSDMAEVISQRSKWRKEINDLEMELE
jgi:hypothetical protein